MTHPAGHGYNLATPHVFSFPASELHASLDHALEQESFTVTIQVVVKWR